MHEGNADRDSRPCRRFVISGHVQGVWFRDSTRRQADRLGLTGYARNLPDGTVEVVACGASGAIDELRRWLHDGPPLARVESVVELDCDDPAPAGFGTG